MSKVVKSKKTVQRPGRLLLATEAKRLALWRAEAKKHNVSLATWVRWACDLVVDGAAARMKTPPTGEVRPDGVQL